MTLPTSEMTPENNPRRRTNTERRKEFLRAMRMLERIALTQADYAYPAVAQGQLAAARGRVLKLFDEAIGFQAKGVYDGPRLRKVRDGL